MLCNIVSVNLFMKKNSIMLLKYSRYKKIEQHKLESKHTSITQKQNTLTHPNYFHTRVEGGNFCFFIAVPSGGGCWYYAKCEMLLREIDGEMNMQNCGYSAKGDGGDTLHD